MAGMNYAYVRARNEANEGQEKCGYARSDIHEGISGN